MLLSMEQLAQYRQRCGISMAYLADMMGKPRAYVNNIEKGNCKNDYVSDEEKLNYLNALYKCMSGHPRPKKKTDKAQGE